MGDIPLLVANSTMLVPASSRMRVEEARAGSTGLGGFFRLGFDDGDGGGGMMTEGILHNATAADM